LSNRAAGAGYADYLRDNGFKVKAISTNDLTVMGRRRH